MRCAVIVSSDKGQLYGITSDEAIRIGKQGVVEFQFDKYKLTFIVDPRAVPLDSVKSTLDTVI